MKKSSGKIENVSVEAVYSTPIVGLINNPDSSSILASYEASSLTTYMDVGGNKFLPTNLSNVPTIYQMTAPVTWGNSIFKTVQTTPTVTIFMEGERSEPSLPIPILPFTKMKYITNGKMSEAPGERSEKRNFGNVPVSNQELYPYVERSDIDGFDFPQFSVRGTRKIPATTADTLCGPVTYTGYTYDRLNYNWMFGNNAGINFNPIKTGATPTIFSGAMQTQEGCATISNSEGELLFYTNGETIYTSGHTVMMNGTGLSSSGTSTQSALIVPQPDSNKYYVFTTDFNGSPNGFEYSIVNMELDDGNGEVETKNIKLINSAVSEKVTGCNHGSEDAYWVVTHTSGDSRYYSYKLNSAGLSGPIISDTGSTHNTARGYMKTSPNGEKIISALYDEDIIDIGDFNDETGRVSNVMTLSGITYDVGPYGLEFSSDSSKFYISDGAGEKLYQFDLSYSTVEEIRDNMIELPSITGASLGALQMGPDEKIYIAELNNTSLHVIHRPNGLGVQCNLHIDDFSLTSSTITGVTSMWGLPNVITTKALSCDRYVYINPRGRVAFNFDVVVNNVNDIIDAKKLGFSAEVYKYDQTEKEFTNSSIFNFAFDYNVLSADTTNLATIPLVYIGEGEFIIKGYWGYNINTLISKQLGVRKYSIDTYKRGTEYGLYSPETDWYFINLYEADVPFFENTTVPVPVSINNLIVNSVYTNEGQTDYPIQGLSDPIVSYNGNVLAKNIEYSATTSGLTRGIKLLIEPILADQMLTYAYVREGQEGDLYGDIYTITDPIISGGTNNDPFTNRVFYNTTHSKYEYWLENAPASDVLLSLNGNVLAENIEYYRSTSDASRLIIEGDLQIGDILEAFYTPSASVIGYIYTNRPTIAWRILSEPINDEGRFVVEFTTEDDPDFENIVYSFTTPYVIGNKSYSLETYLENAQAGDIFLYRIKNEKFYKPIMGEIIYSYAYSDVVKVEIATNIGESY